MNQTPDLGGAEGKIDLIEIGIEGPGLGISLERLDSERQRLQGNGLLRAQQPGGLRCLVPATVGGRLCGGLDADLHFKPTGELLGIGSNSSLSGNGIRFLRAHAGEGHSGPPGLDGGMNVIGPTDDLGPRAWALQHAIFSEMIDGALEVIRRLAGRSGALPGRAWVKKVEIAHDMLVTDAPAAAKLLAIAPPPTTTSVGTGRYQRPLSTSTADGRLTAVQYRSGREGLVDKVYAKREELLRLEVACRNRVGVRALCGGLDAPLETAAILALIDQAREAALPRLAMLKAHVSDVLAAFAPPSALIGAMAPLAQLLRPEPTRSRGRPSAADTPHQAGAVIDSLLLHGMARVPNAKLGSPLRDALEKMVSSGALARTHERKIAYTISPALGRALASLRQES